MVMSNAPTDQPFFAAARWTLTAVALSIVANLVSSQWGWQTLGPVLAIAGWLAFLGFVRWLPDRSRLARGILVTILLLLAAVAVVPALFLGDESQLRVWLMPSALTLAALLTAIAVGSPGALMDPQILSFAFLAAWFATLAAPIPTFVAIVLGIATLCTYVLAMLSVHPRTRDTMRRLASRIQAHWRWLLEEGSEPANTHD
jgi:hypothetical protein